MDSATRQNSIYTLALGERPLYCETFTRLKGKRLRRRKLAAFDMETEDGTLLGKPAGLCFTSDVDYPKFVSFDNNKRRDGGSCMLRFLKHFLVERYRGFVCYAHKGMAFDVTHLLASKEVQAWLTAHGFFVRVDRSFAVIRKKKHAWFLADSLRIFPEKLENVLKSFAPNYTKAPLPKERFSWHHAGWRERITSDTLGLYESLKTLDSISQKHFNVPLSLTMPSTALRAARTMLPISSVRRPDRKALDWMRAGNYSGGRIEIFYQGLIQGHISVFDVNSAYAWALKGDFPIGKGRYTRKEPAKGIYIGRCEVTVAETTPLPPVLSRLFHHAFPVGSFQAILTYEEIAFARETGATVKYLEGFAWKTSAPMFKTFIEKCESLRAQDYKGPLGQTVKLAQNGLYGILGMNPFRRIQMLSPTAPARPWIHAFDTEEGVYVPNAYETTEYRESPNMMPHWAAIITARVRVHLSRYVLAFQRAGLQPLYAHTDSIWCYSTNGIPQDISDLCRPLYGSLKREADGTQAIIVGPGQAAIELNDATWHIAAKGIDRATPEMFTTEPDPLHPMTIEQVQVYRAGTALKRRKPGRTITKTIMSYDAMRNRRPPLQRPGVTRPHVAKTYNYEYWYFRNWRIGKLLANPPRAELYIIPDERTRIELQLRREKISANRRMGQRRRIEREYWEGYEQWLRLPKRTREHVHLTENRSRGGMTRL